MLQFSEGPPKINGDAPQTKTTAWRRQGGFQMKKDVAEDDVYSETQHQQHGVG